MEFRLNTQIETKGLKSKNNENNLKQGLENLKWNLNIFENQAFRFWDFWIKMILELNSKFKWWTF
jgi:hypothetical protein